jgi:serine/threonine-protein kinase
MAEPLPDTALDNPSDPHLDAGRSCRPAAVTSDGGSGDEMTAARAQSAVSLDALPPAEAMRVERQCSCFEAAWKSVTTGSPPPCIEDYLADVPQPARTVLLHGLIALDVTYRRLRGEPCPPEHYRQRFPSVDTLRLADLLAVNPSLPNQPPPSEKVAISAAGRHLLFGELGRGGMGVVHKGHDPALNRELAVKVLLEAHHDVPELVQRFLEEAQITSQLQHPGVVPVHELGRLPNDCPYFTMKLVKGRPLAEHLAQRPTPHDDLPRFFTIFEQVCQTIAYAHARGVIHRDLKPSNVMVGAFGEVQVMDWGLAKVLAPGGSAEETSLPIKELTRIRTVQSGSTADKQRVGTLYGMGTLGYMPPEQARGQADQIDERADVFALGAILCVVLTGQPPYVGSAEEVERKTKHGNLADALARLDSCGADQELIGLGKDCLAVPPESRPRHAGVVAQRMAAYQAGVQERLRRAELERVAAEARTAEEHKQRKLSDALATTAQARAAEERKRKRVTVTLAATLLGLVVVGSVGGLWEQRLAAERAEAAGRQREVVATALEKLHGLLRQRRWQEAEKGLSEAEGRLGEVGPADLRGRAAQARADLNLAVQMDDIRLRRATALVESESGITTVDFPIVEVVGDSAKTDGDLAKILAKFGAGGAGVSVITITDPSRVKFDTAKSDEDYAKAFAGTGVMVGQWDEEEAAALVRDSAIREQLVATLDDWALVTKDPKRLAWLLGVVRRADPDAWRDRFRDPVAWHDRDALEALAAELLREEEKLAQQQPQLLAALGNVLRATHGDAVPLLTAAQARHPGDFWLNFYLGEALSERKRWDEAVGYYRGALAVQPDSAAAHNNLGNLLHDKGQLDVAIREFRTAIALEPRFATAHNNLGTALRDKKQLDGAIQAFRTAIKFAPMLAVAHNNLGLALQSKGQLDEALRAFRTALVLNPKDSQAHNNLGSVLRDQGRLDEAIQEFRAALALDPKFALAHTNLGSVLRDQGRLDEAIQAYQEALRLDPKLAKAHSNLGNVLKDKGQLDEAIREYQEALRLDPKFALAHTNLGTALWRKGQLDEAMRAYQEALRLDPKSTRAHYNLGTALRAKGQLDEAMRAYQEALRLDPKDARAHYNLGSVLGDQGRLDEAIRSYQEAVAIDPKYAEAQCNLGHVLQRQGRFREALAALKKGHELGSQRPNWHYPSAQWVQQVERQLALDEKLPAILKGKEKPVDAAERLALARLCQQPFKKLYITSARFYAEEFEAKPEYANDLKQAHRYNAACAAALAGCGQGKDTDQLDEQERARLRQQALDWLKADLAHWTKQADSDKPQERTTVQQQLKHWQADADFSGVRDPEALAKLPAKEREAWQQLWADIAAVLQKAQAMK